MGGGEAESLSDLKQVLLSMSEDSFKHHLKNHDFSKWVRDILHKDDFADKLARIHSREDLIIAIDNELEKDYSLGPDSSHQFNRFLAKHFVYGFVFGFVVGIILCLLLIL